MKTYLNEIAQTREHLLVGSDEILIKLLSLHCNLMDTIIYARLVDT